MLTKMENLFKNQYVHELIATELKIFEKKLLPYSYRIRGETFSIEAQSSGENHGREKTPWKPAASRPNVSLGANMNT